LKNLILILRLLRQWKWRYVMSSVLMIVAIFVRMLEPKVFQVAIDYVVPLFKSQIGEIKKTDAVISFFIQIIPEIGANPTWKVLLALAGIYLVISVFRAVLMFVAQAQNAYATEKSIELLRNSFFAHIQRLPMDFFPKVTTGELIQRSTGDIETIRKFIGNQTIEVLRLLAIFVFSFMWIFIGNPTYGLIAIAVVPLIALSAYFFFKKEQTIWKKHEDEADKLNAITQENISGIRVVQAFAREEQEKQKFDTQSRRKLDVALTHAKLHTIFWPFSDTLVHIQIIVSIMYGGWLAVNGVISTGELVSFYTYIVMVAWPMRQVGRLVSEMGMALVAMDRISDIMQVEEENYEDGEMLSDTPLQKIEFRNVWFKYTDEEDFVLKGVNLTINPRQVVAILGPTGSGKSTLVKLLLRLHEPQKGEIFINDIPLKRYSKSVLRKKVGIALQSAFLFSETVQNNIAYAQRNASDMEVKKIARVSGLAEIETHFTKGFQTMVGEKGVSLSGGQKQRVSLARTLLQNPDILVLDDVTSAVDNATEAEILSNLKEQTGNRTTLIITHRLTTVPYADNIVVMENGVVSGTGTHSQLAESNAFYKQVHEIQNLLEKDIRSL
jgi:ATP-binding cassette, subfamily B, bacterial